MKTPSGPADLTAKERRDLARLESIIQTAHRTALEEARALRVIRDQRLYRQNHPTFDAYCQSRWKMSRCHAYRLCDWAALVQHFVANGDNFPRLESHARPLIRLTLEQQLSAWKEVQKRHPEGFEAADVQLVADEIQMRPVSSGRLLAPFLIPKPRAKPKPTKRSEEVEHRPLNTPISWYGGKGSLAHRIVALLPPHQTYIEPFFGGGSILFAKPRASGETVNDINKRLVDFFMVLRDRGQELKEKLKYTPYSREEHRRCQTEPLTGDLVEDARRFFVSIRQSYAGIEGGHWAVAFSMSGGQRADTIANIVDDMHVFAERLRRVQIENRDAFALLDVADRDQTCIYLDPPYPMSIRTAGSEGYRNELSDGDHERLLKKIVSMKRAKILISGYRCPLYDKALAKWRRHEWKVNINSSLPNENGQKAQRTEVVWSNF
jgi:DNA adenine methylase